MCIRDRRIIGRDGGSSPWRPVEIDGGARGVAAAGRADDVEGRPAAVGQLVVAKLRRRRGPAAVPANGQTQYHAGTHGTAEPRRGILAGDEIPRHAVKT